MPCPRASCRIIFVIHVSSYSPTSRSIALRRCACSLSTVPVCAAVADQSAGFATARCCRAYPTTNSILAFKPPIWFSQQALRKPVCAGTATAAVVAFVRGRRPPRWLRFSSTVGGPRPVTRIVEKADPVASDFDWIPTRWATSWTVSNTRRRVAGNSRPAATVSFI